MLVWVVLLDALYLIDVCLASLHTELDLVVLLAFVELNLLPLMVRDNGASLLESLDAQKLLFEQFLTLPVTFELLLMVVDLVECHLVRPIVNHLLLDRTNNR